MQSRESTSTSLVVPRLLPVRKGLLAACSLAASLFLSSPAFAQLNKATGILTGIQTWINAAGIIITGIAVVWFGFQVLWQHKTLREAAPIFWGGIIVGAGTLIANWFVSGTAT